MYVNIMMDFFKCYELLKHSELWDAGFRYKYPVTLLRITILTYRSTRYITYNGLVADPIIPRQGIIAGVLSATSELKLYLLDNIYLHMHRWPELRLDLYVDDIVLECVDDCKSSAVENIIAATRDFVDNVQADTGMVIEKAKSAVLSNVASAAV